MADKAISALLEDTSPTGNDIFPLVDVETGTTKKTKLSTLAAAIASLLPDLSVLAGKLDLKSFAAPKVVTGSNIASSTTPNTVLSTTYDFVEKRSYLVVYKAPVTFMSASASVWEVRTSIGGTSVDYARLETTAQDHLTIVGHFTAPSTATLTVSTVATRLNGSSSLTIEGHKLAIIPLPYEAP